jgi:F0F1-type ATP synthase membrane subunit b/b'
MKRKLIGAAILFLALILVVASCATELEAVPPTETPPAQTSSSGTQAPETPRVETASQAEIDALNASKALADTNRTLAMEVNGPDYFPNEWNETESQYNKANTSSSSIENTPSAYQAVASTYNGIAADFENIALDSIPLYAKDLSDEITKERNAALDAGILDITPERFAVADDYALAALAAWETKEYETAVVNARNALPRYTALKYGANAYNVRVDIANHRFASYDNTAIDAADQFAYQAIDQYDTGNADAAITSAQTALSEYTKIDTTLKTASEAYDTRMDIQDWIDMAVENEASIASMGLNYGNYSSYETALNSADSDAFHAIDQYDVGNVDSALFSAQKALSEYKSIRTDAWVDASSIVANSAAEAQKKAIDAKAPVAAKPEYDRANSYYTEGRTFLLAKNYEAAAESYYNSVPLFNEATEIAESKRLQAQAAIDAAERQIAESERAAEDAEMRIEGGTR